MVHRVAELDMTEMTLHTHVHFSGPCSDPQGPQSRRPGSTPHPQPRGFSVLTLHLPTPLRNSLWSLRTMPRPESLMPASTTTSTW